MLYDFIVIDKRSKIPLYRQIYMSVRKAIENGNLKKGGRLPSLRILSRDLDVSKITVKSAYEQLCAEGYIINKPQSGFYVEAEFSAAPKLASPNINSELSAKKLYKYDFGSKKIDENIININEWKKYVRDALNQSLALTSYGEAQGEEILRNALQKYSLGVRSVRTNAENIIVGAGTQPLLHLLCSLLGKNKRAALADKSFIQSEYVFKSHGYKVRYLNSDKSGSPEKALDKINPDILLINPNSSGTEFANMPVTRRLEIIKWAKKNDALIIEDDYNGELRYSTHPVPCVQNYDAENTVYIGSFSKVLLPSVRIGYMALPNRLMKKYNKIKRVTNQTASKTEQIALARYINDGKIDAHLRKARRIYLEKSRLMLDAVEEHFGEKADIFFNETSLYVMLKFKKPQKTDIKDIEKKSVNVTRYDADENRLILSFSGISNEKINDGVKALSELFL